MMDQAVRDVAREHLKLKTLDARKSDNLDFHELSVWDIKRALEAAYCAGYEAGWKSGCK